ncbi:MAG: hypothetical protein H0V82_12205 [Candidatus Protochlamydia sp.]|nr:hypothetical protein [Candidatus Protochlamydia sp.]
MIQEGINISGEPTRLNNEPGIHLNLPNPLTQTFQNTVNTIFSGSQSLSEKKIIQLEIEKNSYIKIIEQLIYKIECLEGLTKIGNNSTLEMELEEYKKKSQDEIQNLWGECEKKGIQFTQMERDKAAAEIRYQNLLKKVEQIENHKQNLFQDLEYWKLFAANNEKERINLESNLKDLEEKCKNINLEKLELKCIELKKENELAKNSIDFLFKKDEEINVQYEQALSLCNNLDIQKNRINQQCHRLENAVVENQKKRDELQEIIIRLDAKKIKLDSLIAVSPHDLDDIHHLFNELQQEYTRINQCYYNHVDQYERYKEDMLNQMQNLKYTADYKAVLEERYRHFDQLTFKDKVTTACVTTAFALGGLALTTSLGPVALGTSLVGFCTYKILNLRTTGKKTILDNNYEKYLRENPELTEFEIYDKAKNESSSIFQEIKNGL